MNYAYQKNSRYFAQTAHDVRDIVEQELSSLGAENTSMAGSGIYFNASKEVLYSINYNSHLCNRIIAPLLTFDCHSDRYLYNTAYKMEWADFLKPDDSFAIYSAVSDSIIKHSKFAALRLKDAIVDHFRDKTGIRPSIDTINPDLWINLHIQNNKATISIDTSGGSLHRRGYRHQTVSAPMIETLAAAIVKLSGWNGAQSLYDPFCGSGTLLAEAYLYAAQMPPGYLRKRFGFERLPDFDASTWKSVKERSDNNIKSLPDGLISGSDISAEAVKMSNLNCRTIDPDARIKIAFSDVFDIDHLEDRFIICNPPYGIRQKKLDDLSLFYRKLGDFFKRKCARSTVVVYFGDRSYIKDVRLKTTWKRPLANGGLDGRLVMYELF